MVGQIGPRAEGIGEAEFTQSTPEVTERTQKEELVGIVNPVHVDTIVSGRTCVAQMAVFSCIAIREVEVLEIMYRGVVVLGFDNSAQARLEYPLEHANGYLLLFPVLGAVSSPCSTVACRVGIVALFGELAEIRLVVQGCTPVLQWQTSGLLCICLEAYAQ